MKVPFEIRFGNGAGESGVTRSPGRSDKGAAGIIEGPRASSSNLENWREHVGSCIMTAKHIFFRKCFGACISMGKLAAAQRHRRKIASWIFPFNHKTSFTSTLSSRSIRTKTRGGTGAQPTFTVLVDAIPALSRCIA